MLLLIKSTAALILLVGSFSFGLCAGKKSQFIYEKSSNDYYTSQIYFDTKVAQEHFRFANKEFSNNPKTHEALLGTHRVAVRIPLPFVFKFYGYPTSNVTLATGGFLYMGDLLHDHLTYSQYIAPLMADFDTSLGGGLSHISYAVSDNHFIVKWENVMLKHCPKFPHFSFSATLFKNGTITFAYIQVPKIKLVDGRLVNCSRSSVPIEKASCRVESVTDIRKVMVATKTTKPPADEDNEKDIKEAPKAQRDIVVGVSDAYLHHFEGKTRRIVEYNSLNIPLQLVRTGVVIYLTPNPSCVEQKTCRDCLHQDLQNFVCQWCPQTLTCSSGVDRDWQRWHEMKCHLSAARTHCALSANLPALVGVLLVFSVVMAGVTYWGNQLITHSHSVQTGRRCGTRAREYTERESSFWRCGTRSRSCAADESESGTA